MRRPSFETTVRLISTFIIVLVGMLVAMWAAGDIGLLQQNDVRDKARANAGVPGDWALTYSNAEKLTVLLFTSPDGEQYNVQMYQNRTGLDGVRVKLGWFHVYGSSGTAASGEQSIHAVLPRGQRLTAYYSANAMGAAVVRDPEGAVYTTLDADQPFTLVGPAGLVFEDRDGNRIPVEE